MNKALYGTATLCVMLYVVTACQPSLKRDQDAAPPNEARGHWVQGPQLRAIMHDLERQVQTSWPQEIEDEYHAGLRSRNAAKALEEACWLADGLAEAAEQIPHAVADTKMAEVDRRGFLAQVETLRDQARELELVAGNADVDGMRRVLESIDATCNSCHVRFRDFAGPLER